MVRARKPLPNLTQQRCSLPELTLPAANVPVWVRAAGLLPMWYNDERMTNIFWTDTDKGVLGEKLVSVPLFPPQMPHGVAWDGTRASVFIRGRLTAAESSRWVKNCAKRLVKESVWSWRPCDSTRKPVYKGTELFDTHDEGRTLLRNVGKYVTVDTA